MKQVVAAIAIALTAAGAPTAQQGSPTADMKAAMEKARRFTQPGPQHKLLERFIGKWTTETRLYSGTNATAPEKGTSEFSWLMPGRWVKSESTGTLMGLPSQVFMLIGYDNFKQSFVMTNISSIDTAMTHAEGDIDPGGKALIAYGTLDEYLTGEHDKMVKYVWRFQSPTRIVLEVHDLPIGESNTKVVEIVFNKVP